MKAARNAQFLRYFRSDIGKNNFFFSVFLYRVEEYHYSSAKLNFICCRIIFCCRDIMFQNCIIYLTHDKNYMLYCIGYFKIKYIVHMRNFFVLFRTQFEILGLGVIFNLQTVYRLNDEITCRQFNLYGCWRLFKQSSQ